MPVVSRRASGRAQPVATFLPERVSRKVRTMGMPASRRASIPAAKAIWVVMSSAWRSLASMP